MPLVSVIIPVYNTEEYLCQCIESILKQTYFEFEIILVDDGSTDNSPAICDAYAGKDARIRVIHQANAGVSAARNTGIKSAARESQYICFVDSDDTIEPEFVELLMNHIEDADAIACGYRKITSEGKILYTQDSFTLTFPTNADILEAYKNGSIKKFFYGPFSKIFRKGSMGNVRFDTSLAIAEDIVFNLQFLKTCHTVKVLDYIGYNYRAVESSATNKAAIRYNPLYEHDNKYVRECIKEARLAWGFDEKFFNENDQNNAPLRYYNEITNLFRLGTPYSKSECRKKIKIINSDSSQFGTLKQRGYKDLSRAERIAKFCYTLHNPLLCSWVIQIILEMKG